MITKKIVFLFQALLIATGVIACAQSLTYDSDVHPNAGALFRHRWWNYYQRGLALAEQQQFEAATSDLTKALQRRDGDQRMARTYGMRFMDYFAHRELGIVHWQSNNLEAARNELDRSIQDSPSAKARYYLDLVRKALIARNGPDPQATHLQLDLPTGLYWTRQDPVDLSGRIQDPNFVSRVSVGGQDLHLAGAQTDYKFRHALDLPQGRHAITIQTKNLASQSASQTVNIVVDRQGPWIVLSTLSRKNSHIIIEGEIFDDAGAVSLSVNKQPVSIVPGPRVPFSFTVDEEHKVLDLEARDRLGNTTKIDIPKSHWGALRNNHTLVAGIEDPALLAGLFGGGDEDAPLIHIENWHDTQTVYMDKVVLSGSVRDKGKVIRLTIDGTPVLPQDGSMVVFSHFASLQVGRNLISIEAEDAAGNATHKQVTIIRKVPKALLLDHRLRLSVFAFELKGEVTAASFAFQDSFIHQLVQRQRFQVVERERLDLVLEEQQLSRTQLLDQSIALQLGRMASAQIIVTGQMVQTRTGTEIVGRVIDCETAEILTTCDAFSEVSDLKGYKKLAGVLALNIHLDFPLVDGIVIEKQGKMILTDLSTEKIRAQRRMLVFDERPVFHPSTGTQLGVDHRVLAKARVVNSDAALSKAELQSGFDPTIGPHHKVITQ